ncbi:TonB-dependent receptor family protein [Zhouia sp. PK063]|uniref:TonB-dependent receptor family protein n=1 Tax=Zhouia sp. PK063 TaxID=3373602 RepID=UPI0037B7ABF6
MKKNILLLAIIFISLMVKAQSKKDSTRVEDLKEVTVSSSYLKQSKVIVPTAEVTANKLANFSPIDVNTAINQIPGIYIQSGAINTNRITIRGVGSRTLYGTNKIRAYFNGIPITNGTGETSLDLFNPEDLQNIEVVKGPKATQYGTNLGGTILLSSKELPSGTFLLKNNSTFGSYNLFKNSSGVDYANEKVNLHFNYDHLETDSFRENGDYNRNGYLLTTTFHLNSKNELNFLFQQANSFSHIPSSISKTAFNEDPSQAAFTWKSAKGYEDDKNTLTGLSYTHRFSSNLSNTTSIFYTYNDHYEARPFNILSEFTNGFGGRTMFANNFNFLNHSAQLSFGGELYKDQYHWKTLENLYEENNEKGSLAGDLLSKNEEFRNQFNVFATVTLPFTSRLKAQFGLNFNKTQYNFQDHFNTGNANTSASRDFDAIIAPNLNIVYQLTPSKNIYANVSKGFNYPSVEETLTPDGVINPEIDPEKGWNYEIGSNVFLFNSDLHINTSAYILSIDDLLVAQRVGKDQYIGRNAGKTSHKGIEIATDYKLLLLKQLLIKPYANASFNFHKFVDFVDGDYNYDGNKLTGVPHHKISAGINFTHTSGVFLITNFLNVGKMPMNDENSIYSDSYSLFNIKAGFEKNINSHLSYKVNAGVNNISNTHYASSILINATGFNGSEPRYYYPGMPRNYYCGLQLNYRF